MKNPRVFVGSASESSAIVDALEAELRGVAVIDRWDVDVFRPGHFTLEELTRAVREVDFAYWEGEHPREKSIPRYFGVGEITFAAAGQAVAPRAEGWFSASSSSDVTDALTKSAVYVCATPDDLTVMQGADRDTRAALVQAKLMERQQLDA